MSYKLEGKLKQLFDIVVDLYIEKGEPIGSKFLSGLNIIEMAPSTLRKYLNILEKEEFLMQPYNSAGRVPTIKGFSAYIEDLIQSKENESLDIEMDFFIVRNNFREFIENLGMIVDGVVVGFLDGDEYYFLGINNLLKNDYIQDYNTIKLIVDYIESKKIIPFLQSKKITGNRKIGYSFIEDNIGTVSVIYTNINFDGYDATIGILAPTRTNYRKNVGMLKRIVEG